MTAVRIAAQNPSLLTTAFIVMIGRSAEVVSSANVRYLFSEST